jgi:hypothetical protein
MVTREEFLEQKVNQLIQDNLELAARFEYDYDPNKPIRKLTLQEKLEINMGNSLKKFRIESKDIKSIYSNIVREESEPQFIDLTFDNNRLFISYYFVDLKQEEKEIEKGENVGLNLNNIPDDMPELQQKYDVEKVLNELTDVNKT